jgi:hypothetical protein
MKREKTVLRLLYNVHCMQFYYSTYRVRLVLARVVLICYNTLFIYIRTFQADLCHHPLMFLCSLRAFFRRIHQKTASPSFECKQGGACVVSAGTRRRCQSCR